MCLKQQREEEFCFISQGLQFAAFFDKKYFRDISGRLTHPTSQKTTTKFNISLAGMKIISTGEMLNLVSLVRKKVSEIAEMLNM